MSHEKLKKYDACEVSAGCEGGSSDQEATPRFFSLYTKNFVSFKIASSTCH